MSTIDLRMIERILCVLFGGLSLFLGYRLFVAGVTIPQSGDIDLFGKIKIRSRAFAPGIFFAAFGALIVGMSFVYRITAETSGEGSGAKRTFSGIAQKSTHEPPTQQIRRDLSDFAFAIINSDARTNPTTFDTKYQQMVAHYQHFPAADELAHMETIETEAINHSNRSAEDELNTWWNQIIKR